MSLYRCLPFCGGHDDPIAALLHGQRHIYQKQEQIMTALDNLKAADEALKTEVTTFLADIAGRLSGNSDADVQAVADDINAEVAALQGGDPGPVATPPTDGSGDAGTGTPVDTGVDGSTDGSTPTA